MLMDRFSIWPKVEYQTKFSIGFSTGRLWLQRHAQDGYVKLLGVANDGWNSRQKLHIQQYFGYKWNIEDSTMAIGNKQDNLVIWSTK